MHIQVIGLPKMNILETLFQSLPTDLQLHIIILQYLEIAAP